MRLRRWQMTLFAKIIQSSNRHQKKKVPHEILLMAEISNNHLGWCWNPINNGDFNYQPQLVPTGFQGPINSITQSPASLKSREPFKVTNYRPLREGSYGSNWALKKTRTDFPLLWSLLWFLSEVKETHWNNFHRDFFSNHHVFFSWSISIIIFPGWLIGILIMVYYNPYITG